MRFDKKLKELVANLFSKQLEKCRRGPRYKHKLRFVAFLTLIRLRTALPLRVIAHLFRINHVTLWRWVNRITSILSQQRFDSGEKDILLFDTTSTRVRTTHPAFYSCYKKARVVKVQVVADVTGMIHAVSRPYFGSTHDKKIWETEDYQIPTGSVCLADKAYVGIKNDRLVSPIRKSDLEYKADASSAIAYNKQLSQQRIKIEHLFAHLKTWRIIHHYFPMNPSRYS